MIENNVDTFIMYNASSGEFYKPNEDNEYSDLTTVTNWNTWMRAVAYWLRDKLDFEISPGPGTSFGLIGPHQFSETYVANEDNLREIIGQDNDWTCEELQGRVEINAGEEWENYRAPSPFAPYEINGEKHYQDDNGNWTEWTAESPFEDDNNRFDIILSNSNFDNLGLRIKYPLTTTGIRSGGTSQLYSVIGNNDNSIYANSGSLNLTITNPGLIPVIKKENGIICKTRGRASFIPTYRNDSFRLENLNEPLVNNNIANFYCHRGYITILNGRNSSYCCGQQWVGQRYDPASNPNTNYYAYSNLTYTGKTKEPYGWTQDYVNHIQNTHGFNNNGKNFNRINYIKSIDGTSLLISITDDDGLILLQFCLYKDFNNKSNLIIAEDNNYSRSSSPTWLPGQSASQIQEPYWNYTYVTNNPSKYGNYGNIFVNSDGIIIPTPIKKYYDSRDERMKSYGVDNPGEWVLENYCPVSAISAYAQTLYYIKVAGSDSLINDEGKILITNIKNSNNEKVKVKFIVVPFNGRRVRESANDTSYLIAIPIEEEG